MASRHGDGDLETDELLEDEDMEGSLADLDMPLEPLPENVYGLVIASLIKDSADTKAHGPIKVTRMGVNFILYLLLFGLQVFLVAKTKQLVSPSQVKNARVQYGKYEAVMYTDAAGVEHTYKTANGYPRGLPGYFNAANFDKLSEDHKEEICRVPMSNLGFLFAILLIWILTVLQHIRDSVNLMLRVTIGVRNGSFDPEEEDEDNPTFEISEDGVEVKALPLWLKFLIVTFILIPRIILCLFMMWLGARWLTATLGFGDVLLNAVALAFIFDLADIVYVAIVPYHTKMLTTRTFLPHLQKTERETFCSMFGMFTLGIVAVVLATLYIFKFQQVLPDYKWDVAEVCQSFLQQAMAV